MFLDFITRNGRIVTINGMSSTRFKDQKEVVQYCGTVNEEEHTWDSNGKLSVNQRINYGSKHELDLTNCIDEVITNPGLYYYEFKKDVVNGR